MLREGRYNSIDIFRLVCAVMVVAIHSNPLGDISSILGYWSTEIIPRIAVPFFFITTGFFYFKKLETKERPFWSYVKRLLIPYAAWSIIYYIIDFFTWGYKNLKGFLVNCVYSFLIPGSYYHLWFFPALFFSLAVVTILYKIQVIQATKILFPISIILYLIGCLGCSYYTLGIRIPILKQVFEWDQFIHVRRILLFGFPFFICGCLIRRIITKPWATRRHGKLFLLVLSVILWLIEIWLVRTLKWENRIVQTVCLYPLVMIIMIILCIYKSNVSTRLAEYSRTVASFVYFFHPIVILLLELLNEKTTVVVTETPLFLLSVTVSVGAGLLLHRFCERIETYLT